MSITVKAVLYSIKVWLTSVITAPILFFIIYAFIGYFKHTGTGGLFLAFDLYLYFEIFEFVFSVFTWIAFLLTILILIRYDLTPKVRITLLLFTGILLTAGTFFVFVFKIGISLGNPQDYILLFCNCFCVGAGVWLYKLKI